MPETQIEDRIYANAFNTIYELGPIRLAKLRAYFGNYKTAWLSNWHRFIDAGIDQNTIDKIVDKKSLDIENAYQKLVGSGIEVLLSEDKAYPHCLKEIAAFPPILYIRGKAEVMDNICVAVVGTRKMTPYGRQATQEIARELATRGVTVVSGLAFGVDYEALSTAVEYHGPAVAVLASPIDDASISPRTNFNLAKRIMDSEGCVISEYPTGTNVQVQNFPIRNRIISGLSLGTIVVEAAKDSGALITANYALEQNREVFAVPGSIYAETSIGPNNLIKKGAKLITSITDILEELNFDQSPLPDKVRKDMPESEEEGKIIELLGREPVHVDELIKQRGLPASKINGTLTILELKGRIKSLGGSKYVKIR